MVRILVLLRQFPPFVSGDLAFGGFQAFALGVKLAMPRVATTMLALLSLTSLRNQAGGTIGWDESWDYPLVN
jgi:hypothetical protein